MGRASDAALVACYLLPVTGATSARPEKGLCVVRHLRQHASLAGCAPASLERGEACTNVSRAGWLRGLGLSPGVTVYLVVGTSAPLHVTTLCPHRDNPGLLAQ